VKEVQNDSTKMSEYVKSPFANFLFSCTMKNTKALFRLYVARNLLDMKAG